MRNKGIHCYRHDIIPSMQDQALPKTAQIMLQRREGAAQFDVIPFHSDCDDIQCSRGGSSKVPVELERLTSIGPEKSTSGSMCCEFQSEQMSTTESVTLLFCNHFGQILTP